MDSTINNYRDLVNNQLEICLPVANGAKVMS